MALPPREPSHLATDLGPDLILKIGPRRVKIHALTTEAVRVKHSLDVSHG